MRIELRDESRRRIGRVVVDPSLRPTRVSLNQADKPALGTLVMSRLLRTGRPDHHTSASDSPREVFLTWDTALDDSGQLRRCVACGCNDLFKEKAFPQVTAFVVALAFIGAVIGALGLATDTIVLILMAVVLVLDVGILVFSKRRLVCYRCRSTFHDIPLARYHRSWDRATADRYPARPVSGRPAPSPAGRRSDGLGSLEPVAVPKPATDAADGTEKSYFA